MILNNYINWKAYIEKNVPYPNSGLYLDLGIYNLSGSKSSLYVACGSSSYGNLISNWGLKYGLSIRVGSGDTPPEASDSSLASDITSSLSNYNVSYTVGAEDGYMTTVFTVAGTNVSADSITIKEIGITKEPVADVSGAVMLIRELLDTPKVVASGETFSLTITWAEGEPVTTNTRSLNKSVTIESDKTKDIIKDDIELEPKEESEELQEEELEEEPGEQRKYLME